MVYYVSVTVTLDMATHWHAAPPEAAETPEPS